MFVARKWQTIEIGVDTGKHRKILADDFGIQGKSDLAKSEVKGGNN